MTAYIIFTREKMRDHEAYDTYKKKVGVSMKGHQVTPRVAYGRHEVLEGAAVEGVVLLEFPDMELAKAWYDSPGYREAREYRFKGCDYRCVIVEGI